MAENQTAEVATARPNTGSIRVRRTIERSLRSRMTAEGTRARTIEDSLKKAGTFSWKVMREHPYLGTAAAATGAVAVAGAIGAEEVGLGAVVAYGMFQMLSGRERPGQAIEHAVEGAR